MEIGKFRIKNYRAIEDLEINLSHAMLPIIGINESGKTTILTALRSFDWRSDKNDNGLHLIHKNRYASGDKSDATITASVFLTDTERKQLASELSEHHGSEHVFLKKGYEFLLTRTIPSTSGPKIKPSPTPVKSYTLDNDIDNTIRSKIIRFLRDRIPFVLYFDDFNDRVPDDIAIGASYDPDRIQRSDKNKEWKDIIFEIFNRVREVDGPDSALDDYLSCTDGLDQENTIDAITRHLNNEIIGEWKKLKKKNHALHDDTDDLALELKPVSDPRTSSTHFQFLVKEVIDGESSSFKVTERSKGFQWFFNYTMKLKFNSQYSGKDIKNAIFLLDEPGSYLHSRAQSELLSELRNVSENNTIVFCTHSQYLLDPEKIRLSSINIAHKDNSRIRITRFGEYKETKSQGALSPVYAALDANFARDFLGNVLITEGITDYCVFSMIQQYYSSSLDHLNIIPGTGASSLATLISLAIGFSDNYCVVLDYDKDGRDARDEYVKRFGDPCGRRIYRYSEESTEKKFDLEDHFSELDRDELRTLGASKKLKNAILCTFYDAPEDEKIAFWRNLSSETRKNIDNTIAAITGRLGMKK